MMLRYLFYVLAVVQLAAGITFFVVPEAVGAVYGATMSATAVAIARYFGAALLPLAYLSWVTARTAASPLQLAIIRTSAAISALGLVATALTYPTGVLNAAGIAAQVVLGGLFLAGFAYYGWARTSGTSSI